jgi:hypothetical protein
MTRSACQELLSSFQWLLARPSAVRAERFSFAGLAVRVIDIAHREPVGHVLLQIGKHRGIFLGNKDCEGPSISGDKSYDEIAVLRYPPLAAVLRSGADPSSVSTGANTVICTGARDGRCDERS